MLDLPLNLAAVAQTWELSIKDVCKKGGLGRMQTRGRVSTYVDIHDILSAGFKNWWIVSTNCLQSDADWLHLASLDAD